MRRALKHWFTGALLLLAGLGGMSYTGARPAVAKEATKDHKVATLNSERFHFLYDPARMTAAQAEAASQEAEAAWKDLAPLFPDVRPSRRITLRLDARFRGATGYATPQKSGPDAIGIRYADLPMLGLTPEFLFRHELTHLFTARGMGSLSGARVPQSAFTEGIADTLAGGRNRLGLPHSFARSLSRLPEWEPLPRLLRDRDYGPPIRKGRAPDYEDVLKWRIRRYVEPSLFLQFLRDRYGWEKTRAFYTDFGFASGTRFPGDSYPAVFRRNCGEPVETVLAEWDAAVSKAPEDPAGDRLRLLSERVYSAAQWYEFLVAGKGIPEADQPALEGDLTALNRAVAERRLDEAETRLAALLKRIERANTVHAVIGEE